MSNKAVNINAISADTLLASTFSQWAYRNPGDKPIGEPAGYKRVDVTLVNPQSTGFSAITFVNKETGQVVIAYRGSDTIGEKLMAAHSADTGTWDPQFTDATNFAKQARAAALQQINKYRDEQGQPRLEEKDINPLVTGHSLGGLLGQVVSKMFGWRAEVFDSLGGGRLVTTKEFYDQAKVLGQVDADGKVIDYKVSDKIINYATSAASDIGNQLGKTEDIPALGQVSKNKARTALNVIGKLAVICLLGLGFYGAQADDKPSKYFFSEAQGYQMPKWVCQRGEGDGQFPEGYGCTGRLGLIRLSRTAELKNREMIEDASLILFGTEELPPIDTEITIKRSAHLRTQYWPDRDDQNVGKDETICVGVGCFGNIRDSIHCMKKSLGERDVLLGSKNSLSMEDRQKLEKCPGPTDYTDYLAAGTVVKILDYKSGGSRYYPQPNTFFVVVEVIETESVYPMDDEKKYKFDRREII